MATQVLVGTYTRKEDHVDGKGKGVYAISVEHATGKMSLLGVTDVGVNPSFVAAANGVAFVVNECADDVNGQATGFLRAYVIGADGQLTLKNMEPSHGTYPCHASVDPYGRYVAVSNYGGGNVALYPIQPDGSIAPASSIQQFTGASLVNAARQEAPHCHSTTWAGANLFALDLGNDKVMQFALQAVTGALEPHSARAFVPQPPGAGPRHMSMHPTLPVAYVVHELSNSLGVFALESDGSLAATPLQTVSTRLPERAQTDAFSLNAEVQVAPSGRAVVVSNRGDDTLVTFPITADGRVDAPTFVSSGGLFPRHFAFVSNDLVLSANQNSDSILTYRLAPNGSLEPTGESIAIPTPVCLCPIADA
ncbi:hypothetical protein SDRG_02110 [Saprolegnia diclina VS20]|uniref:6-phosphogluconolactonase n=1 Tax=Saprolegnia diclina (strain VS20) TaxID=1156394 RepID=T0R3Z6_SAPDV|nr:hypothetical protein SDRG_02110 [Saprolegnia diclina VS20]EQC41055.1 hypothetical protein SDRG_02110 [Saprolegnia diclina VS20]|eukprot:XP_008605899.1 hypothetical protein SDRG_02110 [Saprolegnia diclina VS20]